MSHLPTGPQLKRAGLMISLGTLGVASSLVATAPSAMAAPGINCYQSGGISCLYPSTGYAGTLRVIGQSTTGPCQMSLFPTGYNDYAASVWNNTASSQTYWVDANFQGPSISIAGQSGISSLSSTYYRKLSSMKGYCSMMVAPA